MGSTTDYRYPTVANEWQQLAYDFILNEAKDVTLSMGFRTSLSQGAANNTLLYIDNVRVLKKITTGIQLPNTSLAVSNSTTIYDLSGRKVMDMQGKRQKTKMKNLKPGVYFVNGKKMVVK